MADEGQLKENLDQVMEQLSGRYEYKLGTHSDGLAVDIKRGGEAPNKVLGRFYRACMDAGYVVTGTMHGTREGYTRLFLHEADEYFDAEQNNTGVPTVPLMPNTGLELADGAKMEVEAMDGTRVELDTETPMVSDEDPISDLEEEARMEGFMAGAFAAGMAALVMQFEDTTHEHAHDIESLCPKEKGESDDDEDSSGVTFAPYGIGKPPSDKSLFDVHHSIIDNNHFLWDYEGTSGAKALAEKKVVSATDDVAGVEDSLYTHVTVEALEENEVLDESEAKEYLEQNNSYEDFPNRGGFIKAAEESDYSLYVYSQDRSAREFDTPAGWVASNENHNDGVGFRKE